MNNPGQIHGLTTAAGIWLTAAVGVAAGLGREATAVLVTLLAFFILSLIPRHTSKMENPSPKTETASEEIAS
jgi:putative Mg2+ transporter-C (MgtC) family protein